MKQTAIAIISTCAMATGLQAAITANGATDFYNAESVTTNDTTWANTVR